ncbi:hypothetical protein FLL45_01475 [Aliikangiella marina]|uniref:Uncharacterized protein n=1 Tax=Aliikangiella marina TaxID=1712262 RepID=A0A545THF3_9GAMM|nr:hypothetical protein [Aliikangiella marina]TQV76657.1 hypothetical protein FLL45_01475 [Aliikangiella marina]
MGICNHQDISHLWDHVKCKHCGSVRTDSGWGLAKNQWFDSLEHAKFYQENGRLPENPKSDTEIIRRIIERGMKRAQERSDSEFIDIFQHLKDELERVKN